MKIFKILTLSLLASLIVSCDDFLDVTNYEGIPSDELITSVDNAQIAVNGVYNGLYGQTLFYFGYYYYTDISTGELTCLKTDAEINPFETFSYYDTFKHFEYYWKELYTIVSRANDVSSKISDLRYDGDLIDAENKKLDEMIGECSFLKGFAYLNLTRSFGDKLPTHPQYNPNELGVPIKDTVIVSRDQLMIPRNTLKECWDEVIKDFKTAYDLLPESWEGTKKFGAARKGAAAAYLGEVYMYLGDYEEAQKWFKKVVDDESRYSLVKNYAWNFDATHENNSESVFEVQFQTTVDYTVLSSYLWRRLGADGVGGGFGMVGVNNDWVDKFNIGFELTQAIYDKILADIDAKQKPTETDIALREVLKVYQPQIGVSVFSAEEFFNLYTGDWSTLGDQINTLRRAAGYRTNVKTEPNWATSKSSYIQTILNASRAADPRMYDSFFVPGRDSIATDWAATDVKPYPNSYYGFKKYIPYNAPGSWGDEKLPYADGFNSINQRIFRLADVYLQYAEACYRTGDTGNAEKYLNKVRRRAWGYAFDDASLSTPVVVDYPSTEDTNGFMSALVAEREKELCLEGRLYFDYLRWNMAEDLFKARGFDPKKHHRLPIPLTERQTVGMNVLLQNDGY